MVIKYCAFIDSDTNICIIRMETYHCHQKCIFHHADTDLESMDQLQSGEILNEF